MKEMMTNFAKEEGLAQHILRLAIAVENLQKLGFVHRNLRPEVVFQSKDPHRPLILAGHEYTTQISNLNFNFNIPNNIFQVKSKKLRAGSKRQDLNAFGALWWLGRWVCASSRER